MSQRRVDDTVWIMQNCNESKVQEHDSVIAFGAMWEAALFGGSVGLLCLLETVRGL